MNFKGLEMGCFALGTSRAGRYYDGKEADALFGAFLDSGGKAIDTAHIYADWIPGERSRSERCIGDYILRSGRRDDIFLITKGGHPELNGHGYDGDDLHKPRLSREEMRKDLEGSLEKLHTDHIDLYFYHRDDSSRETGELIETMEEFVREGKILHYGCSNWKLPRIIAAREYAAQHGYAGFCANQALFNLGTMKEDLQWDDTCVTADREMLEYHENNPDFLFMPYSAAANGFFHRLIRDGEEEVKKAPYAGAHNTWIGKEIKALTEKRNCTVTQVLLGYFMTFEMPVLPLYQSSDINRIREAAETSHAGFDREDFRFAQILR